MHERYAIPPDRWGHCLAQFSRSHAGQSTTVRTSGAAGGGAANADELPLIGIVTEPASRDELHIMLGRPGGPHVDHVLKKPSRVWSAEWNDGLSAELEIDAEDGSTTLVRIGPPE